MGKDSMPSTGQRTATNGARPNKDHPPPPHDAAPAAGSRPATPTASGARNTQRPSQKTPARSSTADPSMPVASTPKHQVQSFAPPPAPNLPVPPGLPAPPFLSAPEQRAPSEDWVDIAQPNALVVELQAKIAELKTIIKERDAKIRNHKEELKAHKDEIKVHKDTINTLQLTLAEVTSKCKYLDSDSYRQEVVSIRRHLQVDDLREPWEVTKQFGEIVRKVEDISRDMGEVLGALQPIVKPTTVDLLRLISRAPEGQPLVAAEPSTELEIEDFIDFGCRALTNEALFNDILRSSVFHPGLGAEDNALCSNMYNQIRRKEPQVVAGRWRISTLKLHDGRPYSPHEGALRLCQDGLLPFCSAVIDSKSCLELIRSMLPRFEDLFKRAYDWNHTTRNSVIMLDFHPHFQPPGSPFEVHNTLLEGRKPKPPASKATLLTSKLGLWSSSAVGNGKEPEYSFQTKSTMLAAEFFA